MNRFKDNLLHLSIEQQGMPITNGHKMLALCGQFYSKMNELANNQNIDLHSTSVMLKGEVSINWIVIYLTCLFNNIRLILVPKTMDTKEALFICQKESCFIFASDDANKPLKVKQEILPYMCDKSLKVFHELSNSTGCSNNDIYSHSDEKDILLKSYSKSPMYQAKMAGYSKDNLSYAADLFARYTGINTNYTYAIQGDLYMEHANVILGLLSTGFKKTIYIPNFHTVGFTKMKRKCSNAIVICSKEDFEKTFRYEQLAMEYRNQWLNSMKDIPIINKLYWCVFKKKLLSNFGSSVKNIIILGGLDSAMIHNAVESKLKLKTSYTFSTIQTTGCAILIRHGDRKTCELAQTSLFDTEFPSKGGKIGVKGDIVASHQSAFKLTNNFVDTEYYGEITEGGIVPISPCKDILLGKFDLTINARNLEDLAKDMPYIKDIMLMLIRNEYYLLAYPDVELCKKNNIDSITLTKLFENYKNILNNQLGDDYKIKKLVIFQRMFDTEEKFLFRSLFK